MTNNVIVAAIQMVSGADVNDNLRTVRQLCEEAAGRGAMLLCLPENFALLDSSAVVALGHDEATIGRIQNHIRQLCCELGVWIVAGSVPLAGTVSAAGNAILKDALPGKVKSACLVFDPAGSIRARYDKIHLFDVNVGDETGVYRESDRFEPGARSVIAETPFGRLGLTICYDLRFPELFADLRNQGADIILVPSAFTYVTGRAHWEILLRARAIETQCYVVGINQGGQHSATRRTWGHSMIVDPWGEVVGQVVEGVDIATAVIDHRLLNEVRGKMPMQQHRRYPIYSKQGEF
jgi:nitrilase